MARGVKRRPGTTRVSSKHQVTIPAPAFEEAGFAPGDRILVRALGPGRVVLERETDVLEELAGALTGTWPAAAIDQLRDEWD